MIPSNKQSIIHVISEIRRLSNEFLTERLNALGMENVTPSSGVLFVTLFRESPRTMGDLARSIGLKKNSLTTLVRRLEQAGYISTAQATYDTRVTLVSLTEKGEGFRGDFERISQELTSTVCGGLNDIEVEQLAEMLSVVRENFLTVASAK